MLVAEREARAVAVGLCNGSGEGGTARPVGELIMLVCAVFRTEFGG